MNRETIFGTVRTILGRGFSRTEVDMLDRAIDAAARGEALSPAPPGLHIGEAGKALIKKWEGCARRRADGKVEAYPDPGSADGKPWTIGWGATGPGIGPGTVWTQAQCEERFEHDIVRFAEAVAKAIGDAPTTQNQFDALVSFHYNTGAIAKATLTKLHQRGDHAGAAREFGKWINNDGKPMAGLVKRRADEAALYSTRRY
jgi:lysozyme